MNALQTIALVPLFPFGRPTDRVSGAKLAQSPSQSAHQAPTKRPQPRPHPHARGHNHNHG